MGVPGASLARTVLSVPVAGVRRASQVAGAAGTLVAGGPDRRVWAEDGHAHIQVNDLPGDGDGRPGYVRALTGALRRLDGVSWAKVNAVTGNVLIAYAEREVNLGTLVDTVRDVEEAHRAARDDPAMHACPPDDELEWAAAVSALVADCAGTAGAMAGRLLALPPMPSPVRAAVSVADAAPHVRAVLERGLGRLRTDALLGVANAVAQGTGQSVAPLASDAAHRAFQLYEIGARRDAWRRREPRLAAGRQPQRRGGRARRPCPLPDGPVEKAAGRTELGLLLGGAGVLAGTHDPSAAAELLLATMPKAARHGREAFAAVLGHDLARRGAVVLDPGALRRLDRVSAVVIDSAVLCGGEPRLLSATGDGLDDADVWRAADALLSGSGGDTPPDGDMRLEEVAGALSDPAGMTLDLLDGRGVRRGRVQVGCTLDPMAEALLAAAHQAADVVVLTEHASTRELLPWGDDSPVAVDDLTRSVRALQREGHGVLVVTRGQDRALDAADVGVGVLSEGGPADWRADLLCGPGLAEAWRLLTAVRPARRASERAAGMAVSASVLGALLIAGRRPRRPGVAGWRGAPPVHVAGLTAMLANAVGARRIDHRPPPPPAVRGAWHALTAGEAYRRLSRGAAGSAGSAAEAARPGETARPAGRGPRLAAAVRQELADPLTPVLALGAAASAVVGSSVDAMLVTGVMTGNALIGGAQRMRAERALGDLLLGQRVGARRLPPPRAAHEEAFAELRSAGPEPVPAGELRPGDLILLRAEDVVPADARLLWAESLEVDEAALTGESVPVDKDVEATPGADPAARRCMVYEGTTVVAGEAVALVVATAEATEAGRAAALAGAMDASSSMQDRLSELTREAVPATVLGGAAVTTLGMLRGLPLRRALGSGVALAVAAVPEGLPLVATLSQLAAARRLSGLGVLVRSTRAGGAGPRRHPVLRQDRHPHRGAAAAGPGVGAGPRAAADRSRGAARPPHRRARQPAAAGEARRARHRPGRPRPRGRPAAGHRLDAGRGTALRGHPRLLGLPRTRRRPDRHRRQGRAGGAPRQVHAHPGRAPRRGRDRAAHGGAGPPRAGRGRTRRRGRRRGAGRDRRPRPRPRAPRLHRHRGRAAPHRRGGGAAAERGGRAHHRDHR